jgi:hypothetical protein
MFKLKSIKPEQKYVEKFKNVICPLLSLFFVILIILYIQFKDSFTSFDTALFYIVIISQVFTLYSCFVKWSADLLMVNHYIFVIMLYVVLLSNNKYLLMYYFFVVVGIVIGWKLNNDKCVFDKLSWDVEIMGYEIKNTKSRSNFMIYILLLAYPLKIYYSNK